MKTNKQTPAERYHAEVVARRVARERRKWTVCGVLGSVAGFVVEVLASLNPWAIVVCLLCDD